MKKRVVALICSFLLLLNVVVVFANDKNESQKLFEKYGYDEKFEYNDVMIGFALETTVPLIVTEVSASVVYEPVVFDTDAFLEYAISLLEDCETEEEEDNLVYELVEDLHNNPADYLLYGETKKMDVESGVTGSGVVVDEGGYIVTNDHVVSLTEDERVELYFVEIQESVIEDIEGIVANLNELGIEFSEEQLDGLCDVVIDASIEKMSVENEKVKSYVCFPTADGDTKIDNAKVYEVQIVDKGTHEGKSGFIQDAAILKIDADNLVALNLADAYPYRNMSIFSAGFPSASEELVEYYESTASTLSVTSTPGTVSRVFDVDGETYKAIEINSTISHGNSGGPSVDKNLNVLGLNAKVNPEDKRFAYMVSSVYVDALFKKTDFAQGDVSKIFLTGLQLLQNDFGPAAVECFKSVAESQPDTPYIKDMIEIAEKAPKNEYVTKTTDGNDGEGAKGGVFADLVVYVALGILVLIIVVAVIFLLKSRKRKTNKADAPMEYVDLMDDNDPNSIMFEQTYGDQNPMPGGAEPYGGQMGYDRTVNYGKNFAAQQRVNTSAPMDMSANSGYAQENNNGNEDSRLRGHGFAKASDLD